MNQLQPMLSLLGVMSADEARQHLEQIAGQTAYTADAAKELWERSHEAFKPIHSNPGHPELLDPFPDAWAHLLELPRHESFGLLVNGLTWSVRLVEIDAIFAVAIDVSVRRVDEWRIRFSNLDLSGLVLACLPIRADPLRVTVSPPRASIVHDDLGATWTYPQGGLGLAMVRSPLPVRTVEVSGHHYLIDGYHRAIALRQLGHSHIPSLVLHDANWAVLRGTPRPRHFEPPPFSQPTPPCVGHFLTPAAVPTRGLRLVRVMTMHIDSFIAPVTETTGFASGAETHLDS